MKIFLSKFCAALACILLVVSCDRRPANPGSDNAIYYWRTTFSLSDAERDFLNRHNINKMYLRFFDIIINNRNDILPEPTVRFIDSIPPGIEIVPTIFITNRAMEQMALHEEEYAEKILRRVNAMCRRHGIQFSEIQLDCDWTRDTRPHFFKLCKAVKQSLEPGQSISSTIRLHQLKQSPPPVDKGVLMVYNTGNIKNMSTQNSILSLKDIEPYLRDNRLARYPLDLDVAYPAYGWSVLFFDNGYFSRLLRTTDFSAYPGIKQTSKNCYRVVEVTSIDNNPWNTVVPKQIIRIERPSAREILQVKRLIDPQLKHKPHNNIIYHLDESQLSHFSDHEIDKIYNFD